MGQLEERNKEVILHLAKAHAENGDPELLKESFAPRYRASRNGLFHLRRNAQGQSFPEPGRRLSQAFPDRVDRIEAIVAEGHQVMVQWEMSGTHSGNLFGIPPTGKSFRIWELALFNLAEGRITEGWFMAEELALLVQLGAPLPPTKKWHAIYAGAGGRQGGAGGVIGQTAGAAETDAARSQQN